MKKMITIVCAICLTATLGWAKSENPKVEMVTNYGTVVMELAPQKAPETVKNFLSYVDMTFFDNTVFHRVIPGFMIQGGGMLPDMSRKNTSAAIKNEADNGLINRRGTIAMARTNDPHSATSQFFINLKDNNFLNHSGKNAQGWGYCVFGKVVSGMDVVDKIAAVKTGTKGFHRDVPVKPVMIESIRRVQPEKKKPEAAAKKAS